MPSRSLHNVLRPSKANVNFGWSSQRMRKLHRDSIVRWKPKNTGNQQVFTESLHLSDESFENEDLSVTIKKLANESVIDGSDCITANMGSPSKFSGHSESIYSLDSFPVDKAFPIMDFGTFSAYENNPFQSYAENSLEDHVSMDFSDAARIRPHIDTTILKSISARMKRVRPGSTARTRRNRSVTAPLPTLLTSTPLPVRPRSATSPVLSGVSSSATFASICDTHHSTPNPMLLSLEKSPVLVKSRLRSLSSSLGQRSPFTSPSVCNFFSRGPVYRSSASSASSASFSALDKEETAAMQCDPFAFSSESYFAERSMALVPNIAEVEDLSFYQPAQKRKRQGRLYNLEIIESQMSSLCSVPLSGGEQDEDEGMHPTLMSSNSNILESPGIVLTPPSPSASFEPRQSVIATDAYSDAPVECETPESAGYFALPSQKRLTTTTQQSTAVLDIIYLLEMAEVVALETLQNIKEESI